MNTTTEQQFAKKLGAQIESLLIGFEQNAEFKNSNALALELQALKENMAVYQNQFGNTPIFTKLAKTAERLGNLTTDLNAYL